MLPAQATGLFVWQLIVNSWPSNFFTRQLIDIHNSVKSFILFPSQVCLYPITRLPPQATGWYIWRLVVKFLSVSTEQMVKTSHYKVFDHVTLPGKWSISLSHPKNSTMLILLTDYCKKYWPWYYSDNWGIYMTACSQIFDQVTFSGNW